MSPDNVFNILSNHVPAAAVQYSFLLWQQTPFELKLTKTRQTKVGDFTSKKNARHPRITLNHDLNPYLFLLTYVHEVAHLRVFLHYGHRVDPHGEEWKHVFQNLTQPLILEENVFPDEILHILRRHMINPRASSYADSELTLAFRRFDKGFESQAIVSDLPEGSIFKLQGKYFKKGKLRRTRVVCEELKTRRQYLVPVDALVTDVQLSLL